MIFRRPRVAGPVAAALVLAWVGACGGGGEGDGEAAETLASRLLGTEVTEETRDDHECVADAVGNSFDDETLMVLAGAASLDDLDRPSREQLLQAALRCVSASQLAG